MTTQMASQGQVTALAYRDGELVRVVPKARDDVRNAVISFLDTVATATGQSTFYNTKKEQQDAIDKVHTAVYSVNRGLYAAMLCLPGVTDDSIQRGIIRLLDDPYQEQSLLTSDQEHLALSYLIDHFLDSAPQRLFKLFGMLKARRVNNRRTRRVVLETILAAKRLPFWSVKYRMKLRDALTHAWGTKVASGVLKFVSNEQVAEATNASKIRKVCERLPEARRNILKYLGDVTDLPKVLECVCFILGGKRTKWHEPIFKSFFEAHADLTKGSLLPKEVLEGIRGKFFKDMPKKSVFEIAKAQMTEGQKMASQAEAERDGAVVEFDPTKQDLVKLYVYALERDKISVEEKQRIRAAMDQKARRIAATFPLSYDKVAVILDTSRSMYGTDQAKRRPLAIALAMHDILKATARKEAFTFTEGDLDEYGFIQPEGDTSLATQLLDAYESGADAIYVISDGYENAPAGRFDEVLRLARQCGTATPVYQITPVMAAEKVGVRALSEQVAPLPVARPEALGLSMVRAALNNDIEAGILGLLNQARPLLQARPKALLA